ncbi:hypothetical protein ASPCAL11587 [Aspergillus calidoustus]|uniref:Uncharacterized protein n=1 Tax=Aspergillus calidoustus TaxID=454130 RepID=A0A0U4ZFF3_ASPCI|nr:hypothetical protein ASPCAL11587 [Aspergillus calidoustus]
MLQRYRPVSDAYFELLEGNKDHVAQILLRISSLNVPSEGDKLLRLGPFLTGSFRDVAPGDGRLTDQSPLTSLRKLDANAAQKRIYLPVVVSIIGLSTNFLKRYPERKLGRASAIHLHPTLSGQGRHLCPRSCFGDVLITLNARQSAQTMIDPEARGLSGQLLLDDTPCGVRYNTCGVLDLVSPT